MSSIQETLYNAGLGSPLARGAFLAGLGAVALFALKPSAVFDAKTGSVRPFVFTAGKDDKNATVWHALLILAILAFVGGTLF